jgi:hypothetical protein
MMSDRFIIEPFGVLRVNDFINVHSNIPLVFGMKQPLFDVLPSVGITPRYDGNNWIGYGTVEIETSLSDILAGGPYIYGTVKGGAEYLLNSTVYLGMEFGLGQIGKTSTLSPSSRKGLGLSIFNIHSTFILESSAN